MPRPTCAHCKRCDAVGLWRGNPCCKMCSLTEGGMGEGKYSAAAASFIDGVLDPLAKRTSTIDETVHDIRSFLVSLPNDPHALERYDAWAAQLIAMAECCAGHLIAVNLTVHTRMLNSARIVEAIAILLREQGTDEARFNAETDDDKSWEFVRHVMAALAGEMGLHRALGLFKAIMRPTLGAEHGLVVPGLFTLNNQVGGASYYYEQEIAVGDEDYSRSFDADAEDLRTIGAMPGSGVVARIKHTARVRTAYNVDEMRRELLVVLAQRHLQNVADKRDGMDQKQFTLENVRQGIQGQLGAYRPKFLDEGEKWTKFVGLLRASFRAEGPAAEGWTPTDIASNAALQKWAQQTVKKRVPNYYLLVDFIWAMYNHYDAAKKKLRLQVPMEQSQQMKDIQADINRLYTSTVQHYTQSGARVNFGEEVADVLHAVLKPLIVASQ